MDWAELIKGVLAGKAPRWCGYALMVCGVVQFLLWLPFVHLPPGEVEGMTRGVAFFALGVFAVGWAAKSKKSSDNWTQVQAAKIIHDTSINTVDIMPDLPHPVQQEVVKQLEAKEVRDAS